MQGQLRSAPARASLLFRWATQFDAAQLATAALRYSGSRCASTDAGNFPSPLDLVKQRMGNLEQPASSPTGQESEYQPLESSRGRGGSVTQQDSYERVTGTEVDPNGTPESLGASHSRGFKAEHGRQDPLGASASVEGSTSDVKAHWLERRFPGAHDWLQRNTRKLWLRGIKARCRQLPQLVGNEALVMRLVEEKYQDILGRNQGRAVDGQSKTHLQVASLLLATYKTLSPWIRNDEELLKLLHEHVSGQSRFPIRLLLRWSLLLTRRPYEMQTRRLQALQMDQGTAFKSKLLKGSRQSTLRIERCFYRDMFQEEGVPQLATCTCCSADAVWFEDLERHGVSFEQPRCLLRGDQCCELRVRNLRPPPT
mmetsp:Transcript_5645/g.16130  ORF Transcript_5645/g.16130 Transcript_5645/m.16130 type:complete len:368 (+) Transcript_5645:272-1375(+)